MTGAVQARGRIPKGDDETLRLIRRNGREADWAVRFQRASAAGVGCAKQECPMTAEHRCGRRAMRRRNEHTDGGSAQARPNDHPGFNELDARISHRRERRPSHGLDLILSIRCQPSGQLGHGRRLKSAIRPSRGRRGERTIACVQAFEHGSRFEYGVWPRSAPGQRHRQACRREMSPRRHAIKSGGTGRWVRR